jgi:hypothetical protein
LLVSHLAYGLRIQADVALPGLPTQLETRLIDVRIHLKETLFPLPWTIPSSPDALLYDSLKSNELGHPNLRVARLDGGRYIGLFYSDGARFAVSHAGNEIWADWPDGYTLEDACTYLIGPVLAFALRLRGGTCLHASAIAVGDQAIALLGVPGAGKSTTAAAFARLGYSILSDDIAVLDDQGSRFLVQPGYPRVNLWPDSVRSLFGSEDDLPHITPTWGKKYLALDQSAYAFQSYPLPLSAVYVLDERDDRLAAPILEELTTAEAFIALVSNAYVNYLLDADMRKREFEVLGRVAAAIRVRRVRPACDPCKVFELCEAIAADARRLAIQEARTIRAWTDSAAVT